MGGHVQFVQQTRIRTLQAQVPVKPVQAIRSPRKLLYPKRRASVTLGMKKIPLVSVCHVLKENTKLWPLTIHVYSVGRIQIRLFMVLIQFQTVYVTLDIMIMRVRVCNVQVELTRLV